MKIRVNAVRAGQLRRQGLRVMKKRKPSLNNKVRQKRNRLRKRRAKK